MTQDAKKKEPVLGLTIHLQKYGLNTSKLQNNPVIFGFYDSLEIEPVTRWLKYSPRSSNNILYDPKNTLRVSHYPIKLHFPSPAEIDGTLAGFCYEDWKDPSGLQSKFPCMTIVLVTLTDKFINYADKENTDSVRLFSQKVSEACAESAIDLGQAHCCILPSFGYSDCCILLADGSWNSALKLVEHLHIIKVGNDIPALSTDYIMPVYHKSDGAAESSHFLGIQLSVRVDLAPGYNVQTLADIVPDGVKTYRVSGGADCLLSADKSQTAKALLDFLLPNGENNLVIDMESTLRIELASKKGPFPAPPHRDPKVYVPIEEAVELLRDAVDQYEKFLESNSRHIRQANALRELSATIENICKQPHTGELREIMVPFTRAFADCLDRCVKSSPPHDILEQELQIEQFRNRVGSFLGDLSRSDCFFMEQEQYNHSSVSSTTRLLLAYNRWLNGFSKAIQKATLPENESEYAFLVTSGGCDQTKTYNAFHFLAHEFENKRSREKLPLLIQMSEMSLFDFSGTILRVTHECMHFCGERFRKERQAYIVKFLSRFYAEIIADKLFLWELYDEYVISIVKNTYGIDDPGLADQLRERYCQLGDEFAAKIDDKLYEELIPEEEKTETALSLHVKRRLVQNFGSIFSGYELSEGPRQRLEFNGFATFLYWETQRMIAEYLGECDRILLSHGIEAMFIAFDQRKQSLFMQERSGKSDRATAELIQRVLSQLLISEEITPTTWDGTGKGPDSQPFSDLRMQNIITVLNSIFDVFSESFSDVTACAMLGAGFEDYILMHVFESWDLREALQGSLSNVYRIPAVLSVCFPDQLEDLPDRRRVLKEQARRGLAAAIANLEGHGMPKGRLKSEEICMEIDALFEKWWESPGKEFLIDYLEKSKTTYEKVGAARELQLYRTAFQKVQLSKIDPADPDAGSLQNNILRMVRSFERVTADA